MKFLIDENLSPAVAKALVELGHDAVHVDELGAQGVPDDGIMALAAAQSRVIISADTDFGALLASSEPPRLPSSWFARSSPSGPANSPPPWPATWTSSKRNYSPERSPPSARTPSGSGPSHCAEAN